jgi:CHRD domain
MRRRRLQVLVGVVAVLSLAGASLALADKGHKKEKGSGSQFRVHLNGYNEVPSLNSPGRAELTLNVTDTTIGFTLTYSNLTGPPSMAHIHVGQPGVNGGISVFFCGPAPAKSACPNSNSGTVTGTLTSADVVGPTSQGFPAGNITPLIAALRAGFTYANMHTAAFPAGEIRGQIRGKDENDDDDD